MVAASPAPPSCCGCRNPGPQAREKGKRHGFDLASINTTLTCSLVDSLSSAPPPVTVIYCPPLLFSLPRWQSLLFQPFLSWSQSSAF